MAAEHDSEPIREMNSDVAMEIVRGVLREMGDEHCRIDRDTRIDRYFQEEFGADSLEYIEFQMVAESRFGILLTEDDWAAISDWDGSGSLAQWESDHAPKFTFGRLADLIAERARATQLRSITILGSTSRAAGAFRELGAIAKSIQPDIEPFAPSTPICDRLGHASLARFWARARAYAPQRIPQLESPSLERRRTDLMNRSGAPIAIAISTTFVFIFCYFQGVHLSLGWPGFLATVGLVGLFFSWIPACLILAFCAFAPLTMRTIHSVQGTLPRDIQTFGDLAKLMSGERAGWCTACDYDLTGVVSDRCPECGEAFEAARTRRED